MIKKMEIQIMAELRKSPWSGWETVRLIGRGSFGTVYELRRELVNGTTEVASWGYTISVDNQGKVYAVGWDVDGTRIVDTWSLMKR